MLLNSVKQPDVKIRGNDRRQGEGDTDAEEIAVLDGVALLAENADSRDVCRCADGRAVSAERRAAKKSEIERDQALRVNSERCAKSCDDGIMVAT